MEKAPWPQSKNALIGNLNPLTSRDSKASDAEVEAIAVAMGDQPEGVVVNKGHLPKAELIDMSSQTVIQRFLDQGYEVL